MGFERDNKRQRDIGETMKPIDFGQIVARIDLRPYAPDAPEEQRDALGEIKVYVWVNPPPDLRERHEDIVLRYRGVMKKVDATKDVDVINDLTDQMIDLGKESDAVLAILLSQHEDSEGEDTHWTVDEIRAYRDGGEDETDPAFIDFLTDEAWAAINRHRSHKQKKTARRLNSLMRRVTQNTH